MRRLGSSFRFVVLSVLSAAALMVQQALPQPSSPPPPPANPPIERAPIDPSMVGYIDDAGVHSEIRIRFDAALDDATPDRAEFFYGKCGCYRGAPGALNDPNAPGPGPGIPRSVNFQQLYFYGEYAPTRNISVFTQLPLRWIQAKPAPSGTAPAFPSAGGFGDMQLGMKFAPFITEHGIFTLQFKAFLSTGDARSGLGTNHASIEPSLLFFESLSPRLAIEGEVGDNHPLSSSAGVPTNSPHGFAGDVFFYGAGPSYQFVNNQQLRLAGVLEFVAWNVRGGDVTGPTNPSTAGVNIANVKVGPRLAFGVHHSFYAGYGVALTSQKWYREIFRTEYRYAF